MIGINKKIYLYEDVLKNKNKYYLRWIERESALKADYEKYDVEFELTCTIQDAINLQRRYCEEDIQSLIVKNCKGEDEYTLLSDFIFINQAKIEKK